MEYLTNSKKKVKKTVNVKRGKMYIAHYEEKTFDEVPITLVDWRGEIPDNIVIDSEEEKAVVLPIDECVKAADEIEEAAGIAE